MKFEKKPLYIIAGISGLVVLLSIFSAYALVWWYGIMVFAGLLLALTILVGKKMEWLKPVEHAQKEMIHKPFLMEIKESGKGRSIFDEEFQQISVATKLNTEKLIENVEKVQTLIQSNDRINVMVEAPNNQLEELIIDDFPDYIEMTEPIEIKDADKPVEVINENDLEYEPIMVKSASKDSSQTLEVEELSDEWLNSRLDALYGKEQSATVDFDFEDQLSHIHELDDGPVNVNIEEAYSFLTDVEIEPELIVEQDVEFEDLSKLYYQEKRGENDGTTE